jgi:hypothetical protein
VRMHLDEHSIPLSENVDRRFHPAVDPPGIGHGMGDVPA